MTANANAKSNKTHKIEPHFSRRGQLARSNVHTRLSNTPTPSTIAIATTATHSRGIIFRVQRHGEHDRAAGGQRHIDARLEVALHVAQRRESRSAHSELAALKVVREGGWVKQGENKQ